MKPEDRKYLKAYVFGRGRFLTSSSVFYLIAIIVLLLPISKEIKQCLSLGIGSFGILAFMLHVLSRNPYLLSWSGHLLLLPEETIAELIALKRRRQKQNLPQWKLLLELTVEVLLLLWAIHIQIRLQNLSLPPSKKQNID
jgi:hypothetical protein